MTVAMNTPVGETAFHGTFFLITCAPYAFQREKKKKKRTNTLHPARSPAASPLEFGPEILCLRCLGLVG